MTPDIPDLKTPEYEILGKYDNFPTMLKHFHRVRKQYGMDRTIFLAEMLGASVVLFQNDNGSLEDNNIRNSVKRKLRAIQLSYSEDIIQLHFHDPQILCMDYSEANLSLEQIAELNTILKEENTNVTGIKISPAGRKIAKHEEKDYIKEYKNFITKNLKLGTIFSHPAVILDDDLINSINEAGSRLNISKLFVSLKQAEKFAPEREISIIANGSEIKENKDIIFNLVRNRSINSIAIRTEDILEVLKAPFKFSQNELGIFISGCSEAQIYKIDPIKSSISLIEENIGNVSIDDESENYKCDTLLTYGQQGKYKVVTAEASGDKEMPVKYAENGNTRCKYLTKHERNLLKIYEGTVVSPLSVIIDSDKGTIRTENASTYTEITLLDGVSKDCTVYYAKDNEEIKFDENGKPISYKLRAEYSNKKEYPNIDTTSYAWYKQDNKKYYNPYFDTKDAKHELIAYDKYLEYDEKGKEKCYVILDTEKKIKSFQDAKTDTIYGYYDEKNNTLAINGNNSKSLHYEIGQNIKNKDIDKDYILSSQDINYDFISKFSKAFRNENLRGFFQNLIPRETFKGESSIAISEKNTKQTQTTVGDNSASR